MVSPDELNAHLRTFLVAGLTTGGYPHSIRELCRLEDNDGHGVVDQLRAVERERLLKWLGQLPESTLQQLLVVLRAMFAV